jgi:polyisoprenoid-binding protein YceI
MQAPSGQTTSPSLQARLKDGSLAGEWVLDPRRSSIALKTKVMGLIPVNGVFREFTGSGTIRPGGQVSGTVTVAAASIDTRNARRDTHLRSADFFDSASHPDITFTADGVRPGGPGAAVTGALTIRGQTRPLTVDATVSVRGDGEVELDAAGPVDRAAFGLTWNALGLASMRILVIHVIFIRP